jgi:N utilization substance protein B
VPLFSRIVRAAVLSHDWIDLLITEALPVDWMIGRIDPVLRALLRAGGQSCRCRMVRRRGW